MEKVGIRWNNDLLATTAFHSIRYDNANRCLLRSNLENSQQEWWVEYFWIGIDQ